MNQRKQFKELLDNGFDWKSFNETDPKGCRHVPCFHGLLCNKEECGFKHGCSFEGRVKLTRAWFTRISKAKKGELAKRVEDLGCLVKKYGMNEDDEELIMEFKLFFSRKSA